MFHELGHHRYFVHAMGTTPVLKVPFVSKELGDLQAHS